MTLRSQDFESCASTNSAIPANGRTYTFGDLQALRPEKSSAYVMGTPPVFLASSILNLIQTRKSYGDQDTRSVPGRQLALICFA